MHARLCLITAIAVVALAAADPPVPVPSAGSSSVLLTSVGISREVSFPEGKVEKAEMTQGLRLSLRGTSDPALKVLGQATIICDSAISDAGEDLKLPPDPDEARMRSMMHRQMSRMTRHDNTVWAQPLKLKYPAKTAKSITVSGAFVMTCEGKPGEIVEVDLAADAGKAGADVGGLRFSVDAVQPAGELAVQYPRALEERIASVEPIGSDGRVLETHGYSSNGDERGINVRYRLSNANVKPAKIRITLAGGQVEVKIPFTYKDLPLEAPLADPQAKRAMRTLPAALPKVEPEPAPRPRTTSDF